MNKFKIKKFYIAMAAVMILLSALVIISLRAIFGAISTSGQISQELLSSSLPHVDVTKINKANEASEAKDFTPLDF